ncbi:MAG: hypothetical protein JWN48_4105, partial [Myxococcaceae bacterium]|nr:hypothetical protein [Myxococcaceae bacterium]
MSSTLLRTALRLAVLYTLLSSLGCGGVTKRARNEVDRSRLAYARELLADRRSPVAFERFEKA